MILLISEFLFRNRWKFTGRFHLIWELFHDLSGEVVQLIQASGFHYFIAALPTERGMSDHYSLFALIERWMDTTHTFHTRVGELTISPMRFSAITGIAFGGTPVPFDLGYCHLSEVREGNMFVICWDSCRLGRIERTWYCLPLLRASGDCLSLLLARSLWRRGVSFLSC